MGTVTKPHTFTTGGTVLASEHNANFDTLYTLVNGNIEAVNIANGAVTENKLGAGAVATAKIAASAVTDAKVATGIDAVKLADGTVTNTEFQYLGTVTSNVQTQLDGKTANGGGAPTIYAGFVSIGGTLTTGPTGWSAAKTATGVFTVTHNLNSTDYHVFGSQHFEDRFVYIDDFNLNDFVVHVQDLSATGGHGAGTLVSSPFSFLLVAY